MASDVAARGVHIDGVESVIHFDPPEDHKTYIHRSGRTARAGATGIVISFIGKAQRTASKKMQKAAGISSEFEDARLPDGSELPDAPTPRKSHSDHKPNQGGGQKKGGQGQRKGGGQRGKNGQSRHKGKSNKHKSKGNKQHGGGQRDDESGSQQRSGSKPKSKSHSNKGKSHSKQGQRRNDGSGKPKSKKHKSRNSQGGGPKRKPSNKQGRR